MKQPRLLYHYTSIENLALILKNKTIRFNSLDKMDDLQENMAQDSKNFGRVIFVSSWTAEEKESIPMWQMYSKMDSGVRIALPINPFLRERTKGELIKRPPNHWGYEITDAETYSDTFLDIKKLNELGVFPVEAISGDILKKVEYTDDSELLFPQTINKEAIILDALGKHKSTYWDFQKEWRYMLHFFPTYNGNNDSERAAFYREQVDKLESGTFSLPISDFYLTICDDAFYQMEILKSPKLSAGNSILLDSLISQYHPTVKVTASKLTGLI